MSSRRSIVIVGGGFAGTSAARSLARRLLADADLTLISEESYTTFSPMLPEAVGASIFPEQVVAPRLRDEDHTKDMDFNASRIRARWEAGLANARRTIAQQAWLAPVGPMDGLVVHDLPDDDA